MRLKILLILLICFPIIVFSQDNASTKKIDDAIQDHQNQITIIKQDINNLKNGLEVSKEISQRSIIFMNFLIAVVGVIVVVIGFISFYKIYQFDKEYDSFKERMKEVDKELTQVIDNRLNFIEKRFDELKNNIFIVTGTKMDHLLQGNSELEKGHHELAELYFRMEIIKKPQANAFAGLARAYQGMNKSDEALKALDQAITLDESEPKFNVWGQISMIKAEILLDLGRYQEAKGVLQDEVLKKNPGFRKAKTLLELCNNKLKGKKKK